MGDSPTFTPAPRTGPANMRTRSTGTVHATDAHGTPACPVKASTVMDSTSDAVTCRRCIALTTVDRPAVEVDAVESQGVTPGVDRPDADAAQQPMPCLSWCIGQHDPGAPDLCVAPEEPTPGSDFYPADSIGLSYTPDSGVIVAIGDRYMPYAQARGYALALMRQLDRARQAAPLVLEVAA